MLPSPPPIPPAPVLSSGEKLIPANLKIHSGFKNLVLKVI